MRNYNTFRKYAQIVPRIRKNGTHDSLLMYLDREERNLLKNTWKAEVIAIDEVEEFDTFYINNKTYMVEIIEPIFDSKGFRTPGPLENSTNGINHYEIILKSVYSSMKDCPDSKLYIFNKHLDYSKCKIKSTVDDVIEVEHYQIATISPLKTLDNTELSSTLTMAYREDLAIGQILKICDVFCKVEKIENLNELNLYSILYLSKMGEKDNEI